jgi:hypothetical protein
MWPILLRCWRGILAPFRAALKPEGLKTLASRQAQGAQRDPQRLGALTVRNDNDGNITCLVGGPEE